MKRLLICLLLSGLFSATCSAELRVIGVHVVMANKPAAKATVSIFSDVKKEDQRKLAVKDAAAILKDAVGWGSAVRVGIVAHGVPLEQYLPLLQAVSKNHSLELAFVEGNQPSAAGTN